MDRSASATDATSAASAGLHRRDIRQHQDDAATRPCPERPAADRARRRSANGEPDLHRRPALRRLDCALDHRRRHDRDAFDPYVETQLAPTLQPGDVVILDNLAVHKSARAAECLKKGRVVPVPAAYSPDLNPIEMAFAKLKAHLRRPAARTYRRPVEGHRQRLRPLQRDECWNYLKEAGYVSD